MEEIRRLIVRLSGDAKSYRKMTKEAISATKKMAAFIEKHAAAMVRAVEALLLKAMKGFVNLARVTARAVEHFAQRQIASYEAIKRAALGAAKATAASAKEMARNAPRNIPAAITAAGAAARHKAWPFMRNAFMRKLTRFRRVLQVTFSRRGVQRGIMRTGRILHKFGAELVSVGKFAGRAAAGGFVMMQGALGALGIVVKGVALGIRGLWTATKFVAGLIPKALKMISSSFVSLGRTVTRVGRILQTTFLSISIPASILSAGAIRAFGNFDQAMADSTSIMRNLSGEMRDEMEKTAKVVASRGITSAHDLAKAYFVLASANVEAAQAMKLLPVLNEFAQAGQFDIPTATELAIGVTTAAGGRSADPAQTAANVRHVSDLLLGANQLGQATTQEFAKALTTKAGPALRVLNKDLEEGLAVLSLYARQNVKGAHAGEQLAVMLRDLQKAATKNADVFADKGINVFNETTGKMNNLADIIEDLENAFQPLSDAGRKNLQMLLGFRDRSKHAIFNLLGFSDAIRKAEGRLRGFSGLTKEVSEKRLKGFNAQMRIMWNNIVLASEAIGRAMAPTIMEMRKRVMALTRWFRNLSEETKELIAKALLIAASLAPIGFVIGSVMVQVGRFTQMIGFLLAPKMLAFIGLTSAAVLAVVGPNGLVNAFKSVRSIGASVWKALPGFVSNLAENIQIATKWINDNWNTLMRDMSNLARVVWNNMGKNFKVSIETMGMILRAFGDWVKPYLADAFLTASVKISKTFAKVMTTTLHIMAQIFTPSTVAKIMMGGAETAKRAAMMFELSLGMAMANLALSSTHKKPIGDLVKNIGDVVDKQSGKYTNLFDGFIPETKDLPKFNLKIKDTVGEMEKLVDPNFTGSGKPPAFKGLESGLGDIEEQAKATKVAIRDAVRVGSQESMIRLSEYLFKRPSTPTPSLASAGSPPPPTPGTPSGSGSGAFGSENKMSFEELLLQILGKIEMNTRPENTPVPPVGDI